ncbi:solute carrier family 7 member 13-like isoform X2 [Cricetulus griseus]|uniref:Solute carrier family 7 member 13-like isoform X2 n=1 Tax=Cricetulus griseus TaxID=10029 RepID=A0A9J7JDI3_CRIGR|nr:solute carrier family 7 member 13-like isoform X2 [Cricetulus griseus]
MDKRKQIKLKRELGYFWGVNFLIINIIGAGIFVSPKGVLEYSCMNVGVSLCIWAACAVLSMTSSLCFAEIGIAFPYSGAHYYFIKRCFGSLIAFLRLWTSLFTGAGIVASQALLLVEYGIQPFYPNCSVPNLPKKCLALAVLWIVGILNSRGVRELSWLQTGSTVLKMGILGFISLSGVFMLVRIKRENAGRLENAFDAEFPVISQLTEAFFQGYFAFSGGESFTYVAGELKKPNKTIPRCIFTVLPLVTVVYLLANISYLTVLTPREILSTDAVAIAWTDRVLPQLTWTVPFAISASLFSNLVISVLESGRVLYIASEQGQLPLMFSTLNVHSSPFIAVLLIISVGSIAIVLTNLYELINYLYFVDSIWTMLSMIGILKLRYQEPNLHRPYKVFLPFLFIAMTISLFLVLIPLVKSPKMHYIYVFLFLLSGLLFYVPLIHFKVKLVWFEKVTCYMQLLFNICIPDASEQQTSQLNDNDNNVGNDGAVIDDDNRRDGDEDNDGNGTVINIYLVLIFGISYTLLHYNPPPNSVS